MAPALGILLCFAGAHAEEFTIQFDETVAPGQPGPGAGQLADEAFTDTYSLEAEAGQIAFFEELAIAPALYNWLRWEVRLPSGGLFFSRLFALQTTGRQTLPESGTYSIRFFTSPNDPAHVGDYSFRVRAVPPDQTFNIAIGASVADGVPAPGAGNLETAGAEDRYEFSAGAGQNVFFEELEWAPGLDNALRWACVAPSGQTVFSGLFRAQGIGRKTLPETGTYTIRCFVSDANPDHFGTYAFRLRPIAADPTFPIELGWTIADGVPAAGAGNLESPGAQDFYTFSGSAGQNVFFEELARDDALNFALRWECRTPAGTALFSGFFVPEGIGRKTLPETGTYTIRFFVSDNDPTHIGRYSFRVSALAPDDHYPIAIGDIIGEGISAPGTGQIEVGGAQDIYTFTGAASQRVVFEKLGVADSLAGALRWELRAPGGTVVFSQLLSAQSSRLEVLPATGTYSLRFFVNESDPQFVGGYSFRTFSPVYAFPDGVATTPGTSIAIPAPSLLCNDRHEPMDTVEVELLGPTSTQGGSLTLTSAGVLYAPPLGYVGVDTFDYRLCGAAGGSSTNQVTVRVSPDAHTAAAVVSLNRNGSTAVDLCLLGLPGETYVIEESPDLEAWTPMGAIKADDTGAFAWSYTPGSEPARFYRFRRP